MIKICKGLLDCIVRNDITIIGAHYLKHPYPFRPPAKVGILKGTRFKANRVYWHFVLSGEIYTVFHPVNV